MFNLLLGITFFLVYYVGAQTQDCYLPSGQLGYCVFIPECPSMMNILNSAGQDKDSLQYIRASQLLRASICGYMGTQSKICCNQPMNPIQYTPGPPDVSGHRNLQLLEHNICGLYSADKIIGGENTGLFEFPWMALLVQQHRNGGNVEFFCGGTIINKRYILTAAHCVRTLPANYLLREVRVGEHDTNSLRDCEMSYNGMLQKFQQVCSEGFQTFGIEGIYIHNNYSSTTYQNDIALLRLNRDIDFTLQNNVKPICLPVGTAARLYQKRGIVTGWGRTKTNHVSTKLLKVEIPIVTNEECNSHYNFSTYKQICAGGEEGFDSCTGDSGGPLQNIGNYHDSLRVVQYGIISYGPKECSPKGIPAIYTSIPYYMDWILNNIRN